MWSAINKLEIIYLVLQVFNILKQKFLTLHSIIILLKINNNI